jgi:hypothetical protein
VRDKLNKDAKDQGLISTVLKNNPVEITSGDGMPIADLNMSEIVRNHKSYILHVTKYVDEKAKYDEILSAIGEYFELFKTHTDLLEDLWLQLLGYLNLQNPSLLTVFRKIHYQCYIKLVVQHPLIRPLIEEAAEALVNGEGSEFLASYLEKIKEIKEGLTVQDESYEAFKQSYESTYDFNVNVNK